MPRYLFALCVAALIPLVALLMAKRKVIVDLLRKKIKRVTNRCAHAPPHTHTHVVTHMCAAHGSGGCSGLRRR